MKNIRKIIFVLAIVAVILSASGCLQSDAVNVNESGNGHEDVVVTEEKTLSSQKESTMELVNEAIGLMDEKGELAFDDFRQKGSKWYNNDTYLSIWTTEGIRVAYAPNVSSEGMYAADLEDYNGEPLGRMFIDTALSDEGEGWVDYHWPKPGETVPSRKHTFVKRASIGNQSYLVTSGFYLDDYVYTHKLETGNSEYFTRFGNVSLANLFHPEMANSETGVNYSITRVIVRPGDSIEAHLMKNSEGYYVLAGEGVLYIENVPFELSEGQFILIPAGSEQHLVNTGDSDLEFFAINQPAWSQENEEMLE